MTSKYLWVGIAVGIFFAGIGMGYAIFINTYNPYPMMMGNPVMFNQMMSNPGFNQQWMSGMMSNPQMMNQWMGNIMQNPKFMNQWMSGMMSNQQFGQQYMGPWTMMQNPQYRGMMSSLNTQNFNASSHPAVDTNKISIVKDSWRTNIPEPYSPTVARVPAGTTVTWTNNDSIVHTVTDVNGSFDSGLIQPDATWQYTFNTKGTINYFCTIHPWMKGEVIVS
ncbi:MAG: cupredoxin domain-containing protein [Nitrosotalea sp.]